MILLSKECYEKSSGIIYNSQDNKNNPSVHQQRVGVRRCGLSVHTHTHTNITQLLKKNEMVPFAVTWMNLENIVLSEVSHTEKDKYRTHMWC